MEFVEVMRQWRRMCDAYTTDDAVNCCKGCPMNGRGCGSIYENGNAEPDIIEREVMAWAAEHPEPVYPTWYEFLTSRYHKAWEAIGCDEIPAETAQKLGIEPKK